MFIRLADSDDSCNGASEEEIQRLSLWRVSTALCLTDGEGSVYQRSTSTDSWDVVVAEGDVPVAEEPLTTILQIAQRDLSQSWSLARLRQSDNIRVFDYRDKERRALVYVFVLGVGVVDIPEMRRYPMAEILRDRTASPQSFARRLHVDRNDQLYRRLHLIVESMTS